MYLKKFGKAIERQKQSVHVIKQCQPDPKVVLQRATQDRMNILDSNHTRYRSHTEQ